MDLARLAPSTFTSVVTDLPAASLWPVVADPTLLPSLSTELATVRVTTAGPIGLGTTFEGDQERGDRRWTTTSTVTEYEEPTVFAWTVGDLACPVSCWRFLLDEHPRGTTLTHAVTLLGGPSPLTDLIIASPDEAQAIIEERLETLRARMAVTLVGLLELAASR
jgi:hypothetical protein